jgi:hypothetical protein
MTDKVYAGIANSRLKLIEDCLRRVIDVLDGSEGYLDLSSFLELKRMCGVCEIQYAITELAA